MNKQKRVSTTLPCLLGFLAIGCGDAEDIFFSPPTYGGLPIIGGTVSAVSDFPAVGAILVAVGETAFVACTGTLIAADVVLTAAHCLTGFDDPSSPVRVFFTLTADLSEFASQPHDEHSPMPPRTSQASAIVIHERFDSNWVDFQPGLANIHDVGLLFLRAPLVGFAPARLDDPPELKVGTRVAIVGYGARTLEGGDGAADIKTHAMSTVNEIASHEMQVGRRSPMPQKCRGDSGGPTFVGAGDNRRLVGITSRAYDHRGCEVGGIDTRVEPHMPWIAKQLRNRAEAYGASVRAVGCGATPVPGWAVFSLCMVILAGTRRHRRLARPNAQSFVGTP